jgi:hypothetical protein
MHASSVGDHNERARERKERERESKRIGTKKGRRDRVHFLHRMFSLNVRVCAHRNTLEIKKKRRMNRRTVVSFRLFRQFGLEHALRSLREFTHFSKIVTTGLKNKTKEKTVKTNVFRVFICFVQKEHTEAR